MERMFALACAAVLVAAPAVVGQPPPGDPPLTFGGPITAGTITAELRTLEIAAVGDLSGPGFHIVGQLVEGRHSAHPCTESLWCTTGFEVNLSSVVFPDFPGFHLRGRVTVDGQTLEPANVNMELIWLQAVPVAIPKGNRKNLVLSTPFLLTNAESNPVLRVRVYHQDDIFQSQPWAVGEISGEGIVTGFFERAKYTPDRAFTEPGDRAPFFYYVPRSLIYSFSAP